MEVVLPPSSQRVDLAFDSACSSPYITAPSSPRRSSAGGVGGGGSFSAPTSPGLASVFFSQLNNLSLLASDGRGGDDEASCKPEFGSKIRSYNCDDDNDEEEEFEFSGQLDRAYALSAADELFDGGKIKPLGMANLGHPMRSLEKFPEKTREEVKNRGVPKQSHRGRPERITDSASSSSSSISSVRKGSRSLSPFRISEFAFGREENKQKPSNTRKPPPSSSSPSSSANSSSSVSSSMAAATTSSSKGYRKWRLRDFLLFRSASEGRASTSGNDPLRKFYAPLLLSKKKSEEDLNLKGASFRSTESASGSVSGSTSSRRMGGPGSVRSSSPHELHYKANRAVSEEMRRRTFLPYKQDLLGCLGFNSVSSVHEISRGLGSLTRG